MIDLNELAWKAHDTAIEKGFWGPKYGEDETNQVLAKLMLVDTEVSELVEAYVKQHGKEAMANEFADIVIRLIDLWRHLANEGLVEDDLEKAIMDKMSHNLTRPKKHDRLM